MKKMKIKRIPRKQKKIVRAILLCHTGNIEIKTIRLSKYKWLEQKKYYKVWYRCFNMCDRKMANTVKNI